MLPGVDGVHLLQLGLVSVGYLSLADEGWRSLELEEPGAGGAWSWRSLELEELEEPRAGGAWSWRSLELQRRHRGSSVRSTSGSQIPIEDESGCGDMQQMIEPLSVIALSLSPLFLIRGYNILAGAECAFFNEICRSDERESFLFLVLLRLPPITLESPDSHFLKVRPFHSYCQVKVNEACYIKTI